MSAARIRTGSVEITAELIESIVKIGGYTHPLFNPTLAQQAAGESAPLPGQGILLLMGGLLEQSGALDHAIALVELREVRFLQMVTEGSTLSVELVPTDAHETSGGKLIQNYSWTVFDGQNTRVAEAHAVMLMNQKEEADAQ
ncbi:hypothetical protein [Homoserinimonas sp. OAct 916]|uniref:hypothetical protein n=1 Tax=Homoserinimonas sp. OAct 916 TaxID=2211450 RepID=UPI00130018E9|nr:hypothetical protein [Homoserinimonas sp. OAct 916]